MKIGVDIKRFTRGSTPILARPLRILFVGRLVEKKGAVYLIDAVSKLRKVFPSLEVVVVGDGPLRKLLEARCKLEGLPVQFRGALSSDAVQDEMHNARLMCLPSVTAENGDTEGLPISLLEAQATGLPIVTSAKGGVDEVVAHGITGFRFSEGDTSTLVQQLKILLTNDQLLESMSEAAAECVASRFEIHKCTDLLEEYYDEIGIRNRTCF